MYEDPGEGWEDTKAAKLYFRALGNEAIKHLVECGFPLCKGNYMASRTTWRKPYSVWAGYFDEWMSDAGQEEMLNAKIFFDFRCGFGSEELAGKLKDYAVGRHNAANSLSIAFPETPLRSSRRFRFFATSSLKAKENTRTGST